MLLERCGIARQYSQEALGLSGLGHKPAFFDDCGLRRIVAVSKFGLASIGDVPLTPALHDAIRALNP